jgi:prepilin-type N-terminal cleavage/methylation domain-containing protein
MGPAQAWRRGAFTLLELLVVVGIIALLLALLLPAVQKVRDTANKSTCANHLHQIGLAFHMHHHDLAAFPVGGTDWSSARTMTSPTVPAQLHEQAWGWGYQILPYMEQEHLWGLPAGSESTIVTTPIKIYFCPTRRNPMVVPGHGGGVADGPRAPIDYAGCAGTDDEGRNGLVVRRNMGPLVVMKFGSIPDGISNTLLAGEKRLNLDEIGSPPTDPSVDHHGFFSGWWTDTIRWAQYAGVDRQPALDGKVGSSEWGFGSSHIGGFNALFSDGAVRSIRYTVPINIFKRACVRDDGQPFDVGEL